MDASVITLGAHAPDAALTLNCVALGVFFAISLFRPERGSHTRRRERLS
jgi:hypothetical protein